MKKKLLYLLTLLAMGINGAWAEDVTVPAPYYFNDFSSTAGLTIVGSGEFIKDADDRFGQIYHNDPNLSKAVRTNYLLLPSTGVLDGSKTSKEITIGFWVNVKNAQDYFYSPIFSAYSAAPTATGNTSPMFICESRGWLQINNNGWCDFAKEQNDAKNNKENTDWLNDKSWHYYTVTMTETKAVIYIDGEVFNSWTVDNKTEGQIINGIFTNPENLTYICLGGNQAWNWNDPDPSYGFDDFAVYSSALSQAQIKQIMSKKGVLLYNIGATDKSTEFRGAFGPDVNLTKGEKLYVKFQNHGTPLTGYSGYYNWLMDIWSGANRAYVTTIRADWYAFEVGSFTDQYKFSTDGGATKSDVVWDTFNNDMTDATVELEIVYSADGVLTVNGTMRKYNDIYYYNYTLSKYTATGGTETALADIITLNLSVEKAYLEVLEMIYPANMTCKAGKLGTFIAPFDVTLPENIKAYSATSDAKSVILKKEYEGQATLPAFTPVIIYNDGDSDIAITLYGSYPIPETTKTVGALTGMYSAQMIPGGSYVLQTQTINDVPTQAFYKLTSEAKGAANRCYVTANVSGVQESKLAIVFDGEDNPTAVDGIDATDNVKTQTVKYVKDGQLVIETANGTFNVIGARVNPSLTLYS